MTGASIVESCLNIYFNFSIYNTFLTISLFKKSILQRTQENTTSIILNIFNRTIQIINISTLLFCEVPLTSELLKLDLLSTDDESKSKILSSLKYVYFIHL